MLASSNVRDIREINHNSLQIVDINTVINKTTLEISSMATSQPDSLDALIFSTILLFHTEKGTFVLSELEDYTNICPRPVHAAIGGVVSSRDQFFNPVMIESISKQLGLKKDGYKPNTILSKLSEAVLKNHWGKKVCLHFYKDKNNNNQCEITAVKHIKCAHSQLNKIKHALHNIERDGIKSAFIFFSLDAVIETAFATRNLALKTIVASDTLGIQTSGIHNHLTIVALAKQGALGDTQIKSQTKKNNNFKNRIENFSKTVPDEMLIIISCMTDARSMLSFFLSSKSFSLLLNRDAILWEKLCMTRDSYQSTWASFHKRNELGGDYYKKKWLKLANAKVNMSDVCDSHLVVGDMAISCSIIDCSTYDNAIRRNNTINSDTSFVSNAELTFTFDKENEGYIYYKQVNPKKINQWIKEDNGVELLSEASRYGDLIPAILLNQLKADDIFDLSEKLYSYNNEYGYIMDIDSKFILVLMPSIIAANAVKCFDLFIQVYYLMLNCLGRTDYLVGSRMTCSELKDIICKANDPYFNFQFIQLTLKYSDNKDFIKTLIELDSCDDNNHLFIQALNALDDETNLKLLQDKEIRDLLCPHHPNPFFQLHYQLVKAKDAYLEYQHTLMAEIRLDNKTTAEMQEMLQTSHCLENEMMKVRMNRDEYLTLREEKHQRSQICEQAYKSFGM